METCVNCACQFLDPYQNSDDDDDENSREDLKPLNVYEPLSTIYKLNYLSAFEDSSSSQIDSTEMWKLCENCLCLFTNLRQFYEDFNQLRSLESKLAIELQKLDDYIQTHRQQENDEQEEDKNHGKNNKRKQKLGVSPVYSDRRPLDDFDPLEKDPLALPPPKKLKTYSRIKTKPSDNSNSEDTIMPRVLRPRTTRSQQIPEPESEDSSFILSNVQVEIYEIKKEDETSQVKQEIVEIETDEEEDDDDSLGEGADPIYIPTRIYEEGEVRDPEDDDYDDFYPREKKYKKAAERGNPNANATKQRTTTVYKWEYVYNYKKRKTQVPNPCWDCEMDFPTPKQCFDHTMEKHCKEGDYVCEDCSKISQTKKSHMNHMKKQCDLLRPGELLPKWNCEKCEEKGITKTFFLDASYKQHLSQMHNDCIFKCTFPGCSYTTNASHYLRNHTKQLHTIQPVEERTCTICNNKVFKTKVLFKIHYDNQHTAEGHERYQKSLKVGIERRKEKRKNEPRLRDVTFCSDCNVDMLTRLALVSHRKSVHGDFVESSFVCELCGKSFMHRYDLTKHTRIVHTDPPQRQYCDQCGQSFKTREILANHIKNIHIEEGRLKAKAHNKIVKERIKLRKQALAQLAQSQNQSQPQEIPQSAEVNSNLNSSSANNASESGNFSNELMMMIDDIIPDNMTDLSSPPFL